MTTTSATRRPSSGRKAARGRQLTTLALLALPLALTMPGCGSGGGSGGSNRFTLVSTNGLENNSIWQLNRPIELTFSQAVDLATANLNSVQIHTVIGTRPAIGEFFIKPGSEGKTLVFQPLCPTNNNLDNGGLTPGTAGGQGVRYRVALPTASTRSTTLLQSSRGSTLSLGATREFVTPSSPTEYFLDPKPNAPPSLTEITLGGNVVFPDPVTGGPPTQAIPIGLNTFTNPIEPLVLTFDQPVFPAGGNVSSRTIQLFYEPTPGTQVQLPATISLIDNCAQEGSTILVSPEGILPADQELTLIIRREFQDLVGERNLSDISPISLQVQSAPLAELDAFSEDFLSDVNEDPGAIFAEPRAEWSDTGALQPATTFEGTNPDFIWVVDTQITIDTDFDTITNQAGNQTLPVVNGVIDVFQVRIGPNGNIAAQGSNPLTILATEDIVINGRIAVDGTNSNGTNTLCTAFIPETGAPGQCGGGKGGDGSWETTTSTPRGASGNGPFDDPGSGGQGGESGYGGRGRAQEDRHRPGGGGGGSFGTLGVTASDGHSSAFGAESRQSPPRGGNPGPSPFTDGDPSNNFFGTRVTTNSVIFGELVVPLGGQGGGGGGDGIQSTGFPNPSWNDPSPSQASCDMKGAGGGGAAGILIIKSLGAIDLSGAELSADGGNGGGGETAPGIGNRVAGGSGAGSGGMIVVMSGDTITTTGANIHARGGRGGCGRQCQPWPATSAGGAGGDGVIQFHVGDPATNLIPGVPNTSPATNVLVPDFGAVSKAQTRWINTGFTTGRDPMNPTTPFYLFPGQSFAGMDPATGLIDRTANDRVVHPGLHDTIRVPETNFDASSLIRLTIPGRVRQVPNPKVLVGWEIQDINGGPAAPLFTIVSASDAGGDTVIEIDFTDLPFQTGTTQRETIMEQFQFTSGLCIIGFYPRFYSIETDGIEDFYPQSTTVRFSFQGANTDPNDPRLPDLTSLVPDPMDPTLFTSDVIDLIGKEWFRVQIEFDLAADGMPLRANSPKPTLNHFTLPFEF